MFCGHGLFLVTLFCALTVNGWNIYREPNPYKRVDELYKDIENIINENLLERDRHQGNDVNEEELNKDLQDLPKNDELFEGDMVMDERLRNAVLGKKKSVIAENGIKWPDNTIVYEVAQDFKDTKEGKQLLDKAIKEFETRTCIRFRKRNKNDKNYVIYTSGEDVCSSNIGMMGGAQKIHIGVHCMVLGTVLHETMHALGFVHEHSRPDRDQYVKVKWENINKDERSNFNKYAFNDVSNEGIMYNFASVMHYRNDAFTNNGKDTLVAIGEEDLKFGQRIKFSVGDVQGINKFYNCVDRLKDPKHVGLFKDYSGARDAKLRENKLRQHFYDRQN